MSCELCNRKGRPLFETNSWRVFLDDDQAYLGSCTIILKRHAGALSMLNLEESKDFGQVVRRIELVLKSAFEPELFNLLCTMDEAYQSPDPDPHVHWQLIPRYRKPVAVEAVTFSDPEFGKPYDRARQLDISENMRNAIRQRLLHFI